MVRRIAALFSVLFVIGMFVETADAQRRRRRRPRPSSMSTMQAQPEPEPEAEPEGDPEAAPLENGGEPPMAAPEEQTEELPPEPEPEPITTAEQEASELPDLSPLRSEFSALMDELVQARSRIAVLGQALFNTKLRVRVENDADDQILSGLTIRLDGAPIFRTDSDVGGEGRQVFDGFAAPGPHELTVEAEQRSRESEEYRYTQSNRYRFQVVSGKLIEVTITLDDDSDIAEDFEDDGEGEYDVRMRVRVATRDLGSEN